MKTMKKFFGIVTVLIALLVISAVSLTSPASALSKGDVIEFGSYPQTQVKDENLISQLNSKASDWQSYGYTWGDGSYGSEKVENYGQYTDILYNGSKYRGVKYSKGRPTATFGTGENTYLKDFEKNIVKWYLYEPIEWYVINPSSGLLFAAKVLDSQPFGATNTGYATTTMSYNDSLIKKWLNSSFSNTAFDIYDKKCLKEIRLPSHNNEGKIDDYKFNYSDYYLSQGGWSAEGWYWTNNTYSNSEYVYVQGITYVLAGFAKTNVGVRPVIQIDVEAYNKLNSEGTFHGTYESSVWVVSPNDSVVSEITVDGKSYDMNIPYSHKIDLIKNESQYKGEKVIFILEKGEVVWLKRLSDINTLSVNLDFSENTINYRKKLLFNNFSEKHIDVTVRISNSLSLWKLPDNIDKDVLYSIPEFSARLTKIELSSSLPSLMNFDGKRELSLNFSPVTIPFGETYTIETTAKIDINQDYELNPEFDSEEVIIQSYTMAIQDNQVITKIDKFPITFKNKEYDKPKAESTANPTQDFLDDASKELETNIENNVISLQADLFGTLNKIFTNAELKAIETKIFTSVIASTIPEYEDSLFENVMGFDSKWFGLVHKGELKITEAKNHSVYGPLKVVFTCNFTKYGLGGIAFAVKGDIDYEVIGSKPLSLPSTSGFAGSLYSGDVNKFATALENVANEMRKSGYDWGDVSSDTVDVLFGKTVNALLKSTKYGDQLVATKTVLEVGKKIIGLCPVNIYAYNSENELVASIENNEVTLSTENAKASVEGDTKIIWLYDDSYRIEYVSLAEYDMKVVVEEYGSSVSHLRTTTIENIPLEIGTSYTQTIDNTILEDTDYSLVSNKGITHSPTSDVIEIHEHTTDEGLELIRETSCTDYGFYCGLCSICNEWFRVIIDETGHTESEWIVDAEAKCMAEGSKHIECTECKEVLKEESIPALTHTYNTTVIAPTCEAEGYTTYTCICGDTYKDNYIPATGHSYTNQSCTNCGQKCSHLCHKTGFLGFIWKIVRFFWKLFKINPNCVCGTAHY